MKNLNLKAFVYIFLFVSGLLWICIALFTNIDLSKLWKFFLILPKVAAIDLVLITIFTKWGWKLKIFQGWLVPFPDLNGTWEGHIQTTWVSPDTGKSPGPIPVILTIKQSFGSVSCVMRTAEMTSYSYAEEFKLENDNQIRQLSYSYTSKPKLTVADRSTAHDGTIVFEIIGALASKLEGRYWTARKSTGEITLKFRSKNHIDEIPEDLGKHPLSESTD
jgi:uncharacterized protein YdeI (BOF family)